jgi:hypothetical protein
MAGVVRRLPQGEVRPPGAGPQRMLIAARRPGVQVLVFFIVLSG